MPLDNTAALPFSAQLLMLVMVKILFLIGALLYVVFGFIVVRQIHLMRSTVVTPFSSIIQLLGFVHLLFAFLVLILFMIAL